MQQAMGREQKARGSRRMAVGRRSGCWKDLRRWAWRRVAQVGLRLPAMLARKRRSRRDHDD